MKKRGSLVAAAVLCALAAFAAMTFSACGGSEAKPTSQERSAVLGAGHQELEAQTHTLDLVARDQRGTGPARLPRIEITVPEGWFNFDGWGISKGRKLPFPLAVSFWDVAQVYPTRATGRASR